MTYRKWDSLYTAYKNNFDLEMIMHLKGIGYRDLVLKQEDKEDVISF